MTQVTQEHLDAKIESLDSKFSAKIESLTDKVSLQNKIIGFSAAFLSLVMTIIVTLFIAQTISLGSTIQQIGENKITSSVNHEAIKRIESKKDQ